MLGRTLGGATVASFQGIIVLIISTIIGFRPDFYMIIPALVFMVLIALVFTALGTAIASTLEDMQGFQLIMNFVVMPVFFLSGSLFPLNTAPQALKIIALFNPLSYGVDGLRAVLTGAGQYSAWLDFGVLAVIALAFISIGAWLFSKIKA
jgi:ABC-2 type transport system permease protein